MIVKQGIKSMSESDDDMKELLRQLIAAQLLNCVYSLAILKRGKADLLSDEHAQVISQWREMTNAVEDTIKNWNETARD